MAAQASLFGPDAADDITEGVRQAAIKRMVWTDGIELLIASGVSDGAARSFLGKRVRDIGSDALALGVASAIVRRVADPRAYLGAVKPLPAQGVAPSIPDDSEGEYDPGFFENEPDDAQ